MVFKAQGPFRISRSSFLALCQLKIFILLATRFTLTFYMNIHLNSFKKQESLISENAIEQCRSTCSSVRKSHMTLLFTQHWEDNLKKIIQLSQFPIRTLFTKLKLWFVNLFEHVVICVMFVKQKAYSVKL